MLLHLILPGTLRQYITLILQIRKWGERGSVVVVNWVSRAVHLQGPAEVCCHMGLGVQLTEEDIRIQGWYYLASPVFFLHHPYH